MQEKRAHITGITRRDGVYLAEFLLYKFHEAYGLKRRGSLYDAGRIGDHYEHAHESEIPMIPPCRNLRAPTD